MILLICTVPKLSQITFCIPCCEVDTINPTALTTSSSRSPTCTPSRASVTPGWSQGTTAASRSVQAPTRPYYCPLQPRDDGVQPLHPVPPLPPAPDLLVPDLQRFAADAVEDGEETALERVFEHFAGGLLRSQPGAGLGPGDTSKGRRQSRGRPWTRRGR